MKEIRLATVFSGIGAIESALDYLNYKHQIVFACDNGERTLPIEKEEINKLLKNKTNKQKQKIIKELYETTNKENYVKDTYFANYKIEEDNWYEDIRFLDAKEHKNKIDLYVGGSPCQSFSINGKRGGFEDTRGTLFYDYARIIKECKPKVFIYENVRGMLNHDNGKTWQTIKNVFDELKYDIYINTNNGKESLVLNSKDYGIPQNRERLFVVGFRKDLKIKNYEFPKPIPLTKTVYDYLEKNVDSKYYLKEKGFKFVTSNPSRARVGRKIMGCQKANQQFNWNGDFIFEGLDKIKNRKDVINNAYIGTYNGEKGVCRKYTPRECLRLMGYKDSFKIIHKDEIMYRQSGNSIVVDVLIHIVESIKKTGAWDAD